MFDDYLLRDVSIKVRSGEFVVIRGPSGIGKSTFMGLIAGDLVPAEGSVCIDGFPSFGGVQGVAAVLSTDRLIFGTIEENVRFYRRWISPEDVSETLARCGLDVSQGGFKTGQKTIVGEGMMSISSGQRQRILLARAICDRPKILLLDEATSHLDVESERKVLAYVKELGATVIAVAHRPEAWRFGDRIIDISELREAAA